MISFLLVVAFGIIVGILTGLLPALPIYTGAFILYYFGQSLPLEHIITFWILVLAGSQYFGSVSTITTKIPGEEGSIVYLNDIDSLSLNQRNALLYDTALGSFIASIISLLVVYGIVVWSKTYEIIFFSSLKFQLICYIAALLSFILLNKNILVTIALISIGLILGPKNNYALPTDWFRLENLFQGYTFFMVLLGTMIIPQMFTGYNNSVKDDNTVVNNRSFSILQGIKSSFIGIFVGFVPGPSAFLASLAAYKTAGKDISKKIVAAETANNSSVITCILPLLLLALPVNQNTLILSNIMDIRSINIVEAIFKPSFIPYLNVLQLVIITCLISMILYFWLSTHLISVYSGFINTIHGKMKYILLLIIALLIAADIGTSSVTISNYAILLSVFSALGILLKLYDINPLPLLFSMILGDKVIWLCLQYYTIHFGG